MAFAGARRRSGFAHDVEVAGHSLISDEPPDRGGTDEGPRPVALLAAALASCTAITVEMYADRKGWELPDLYVEVDMDGSLVRGDATYEVTLHLPDGLSEDQTERIARIAGKCPVHKAIAGEVPISIKSRADG
jgi:putative redox protein